MAQLTSTQKGLAVVSLVVCPFLLFVLARMDWRKGTARQGQAVNSLKYPLYGLQGYDQLRTFPPAYSRDAEGKPLLSWRVLILPHVDEAKLYKKFHLDEPWDSPHNLKLIPEMPSFYRSARFRQGTAPAPEGTTPYLALRGPRSVLNAAGPVAMKEIKAGLTRTAVLVEVQEPHEVIWTRPDDFEIEAPGALYRLHVQYEHYLFGYADGAVHALDKSLTFDQLQAVGDFTRGLSPSE